MNFEIYTPNEGTFKYCNKYTPNWEGGISIYNVDMQNISLLGVFLFLIALARWPVGPELAGLLDMIILNVMGHGIYR